MCVKIRRASKNVVRDKTGKVHLGGDKAVKSLFGRKGTGCKSFTKGGSAPSVPLMLQTLFNKHYKASVEYVRS